MAEEKKTTPRNFFLNEQHELTREEKAGGGRVPEYSGINWAAKGAHISHSLKTVRDQIHKSADPLRESRFFLLAKPTTMLLKVSTNKKLAPTGTVADTTEYAKDDSRVFRKLGMDLLQINADGSAVVHARPERIEQLMSNTSKLDDAGQTEQARWAKVDEFGVVPPDLRIDNQWLGAMKPREFVDAVVEMQPLLSIVEIDVLLRSIAELLRNKAGEGLTGTGSDFSGRRWCRGKISREALMAIARDYFSVQSLHGPLHSVAAAQGEGHFERPPPRRSRLLTQSPFRALPFLTPEFHTVIYCYRSIVECNIYTLTQSDRLLVTTGRLWHHA